MFKIRKYIIGYGKKEDVDKRDLFCNFFKYQRYRSLYFIDGERYIQVLNYIRKRNNYQEIQNFCRDFGVYYYLVF